MPIDPEVRSMLEILDAGFPRVEQMTGPEARAAVRARLQPVPNPEPVASVRNIEIDGPSGAIPVRVYWKQYAPGGVVGPVISPARARTLAGLPPAVVVTAGRDPLCSEGDAYAARLASEGVPTIHRRYDDLFHGFLTVAALSVTQVARKQLWEDLTGVLGPEGR